MSFIGRDRALREFLTTLYHRPQIIDPRTVTLQLGGNDYAYLMGADRDSDLPRETRTYEQPQIHPAPYSTVPEGAYTDEMPVHPIMESTRRPGLPVIARVGARSPTFNDVDCKLFAVSGDARTGERGDEIRCHLSHAGEGTPPGYPDMWSMIALTPYQVLKPGTYEAVFKFTEGGAEYDMNWRFSVGR